MILVFKGGDCIAAGPATSRGSELKYLGDRQTPKYTVSIRVKNEKREDGTWASEYLDCCVWREAAENMPEIGKGELVFAVGKLHKDHIVIFDIDIGGKIVDLFGGITQFHPVAPDIIRFFILCRTSAAFVIDREHTHTDDFGGV